MEKPPIHNHITTEGGTDVPAPHSQYGDEVIPTQRTPEADNNPENYTIPTTVVEKDDAPQKRSRWVKFGAAVAGAAVVGGGVVAWMGGSKGRTEYVYVPAPSEPQPTLSAEPHASASASKAPTTSEKVASTAEKEPAAFTVGPDNKAYTAEEAVKLGRITKQDAADEMQAATLYVSGKLAAAANLNVAPKAKFNYGARKTDSQLVDMNAQILKDGLFGDLGSKHNVVSPVVLADYIEFGTLAHILNKSNLDEHNYSEITAVNPSLKADGPGGQIIVIDTIVDPKDVLVGTDDTPGTKKYKAYVHVKFDQAKNTWDFSGSYFAEAHS